MLKGFWEFIGKEGFDFTGEEIKKANEELDKEADGELGLDELDLVAWRYNYDVCTTTIHIYRQVFLLQDTVYRMIFYQVLISSPDALMVRGFSPCGCPFSSLGPLSARKSAGLSNLRSRSCELRHLTTYAQADVW